MANNQSCDGNIFWWVFTILIIFFYFGSPFRELVLVIISPFILVVLVYFWLCLIIHIIPLIISTIVGWITPTTTNRTNTTYTTNRTTTNTPTRTTAMNRTTINTPTNITENYRFKDLPDDIDNILRDLSNGEIKDPITQETFIPGDTVYLCHRHRLAYHEDSWNETERKCTDCGNGAHTKKYTLRLIPKINPIEEILWENIINYPPRENIPLELPLTTNLQQLEPIEEVVDDLSCTSLIEGETELVRSSHFSQGNAYTNFYILIDRLTQLPTLEVPAVQNILGVIFYQAGTDNYIIKYENNHRGTFFSTVWLLKSRSDEVKNSLYLVMGPDVQIPLSEIIIYYDLTSNTRRSLLLPNRQGLLIPYNLEKEIGNYSVRFYADTNEERTLKTVLLHHPFSSL